MVFDFRRCEFSTWVWFLAIPSICFALAITRPMLVFPPEWPGELNELKSSGRTIGFHAGVQENIHEINFSDREKFERFWPILLTVKTPGAPLTLLPISSEHRGGLTSDAAPTVRIFAPPGGGPIALSEADNQPWDSVKLEKEGKALRASPPWPPHLISAKGELPEYVQVVEIDGKLEWVHADRDCREGGFLHRARVDIDLVVDGSVINLNRIRLPSDGPIIDKRFDARP